MTNTNDYGGKLLRLFRLLNLLAHYPSKYGITAAEAANRLNVNTRTIYRDLILLEKAGWPIQKNEQNKYKIRKEPNLEALIWFTPEEAALLRSAVQALSDGTVKTNLLHKLDAFKPSTTDESMLSNTLASKHLHALQIAIDKKMQTILLEYRSLNQQANNRTIEPIAIINGGKHLFALEVSSKMLKMYHLNRIGDLKITNTTFQLDFLHEQPHLDFFGITYSPKTAFTIEVWISPLAEKLLLEEYPRALPFIQSELSTDGRKKLIAPVGILIQPARYFMGLLDEVTVCAPTALVDLISEKLTQTKIVKR